MGTSEHVACALRVRCGSTEHLSTLSSVTRSGCSKWMLVQTHLIAHIIAVVNESTAALSFTFSDL